jgi:hypothetical protein
MATRAAATSISPKPTDLVIENRRINGVVTSGGHHSQSFKHCLRLHARQDLRTI